ncbi:hypothetical protein OF83DRAFT_1179903 [Amylostereum chailletii]|nr:hypothetical protein OF83DRAFT_1179906 [Amylostereum chailletii]KAI0309204.1 hypothetical protein OF83DRAFT_1179903 [Amylostereum chailletii]
MVSPLEARGLQHLPASPSTAPPGRRGSNDGDALPPQPVPTGAHPVKTALGSVTRHRHKTGTDQRLEARMLALRPVSARRILVFFVLVARPPFAHPPVCARTPSLGVHCVPNLWHHSTRFHSAQRFNDLFFRNEHPTPLPCSLQVARFILHPLVEETDLSSHSPRIRH